MGIIARVLWRLSLVFAAARSAWLLGWYRVVYYPGLKTGRGVMLGRGAQLKVLRGATLTIGDKVAIEAYAQVTSQGSMFIGAHGFIGRGSVIVAAERIEIGRDALIGEYVTVRDQDHGIDAGRAYREQSLVSAPVTIGSNVWIGAKASVLKGASIGDGAVVGAHALIIDDVEAATMVAGVPAKLIRRLKPASR